MSTPSPSTPSRLFGSGPRRLTAGVILTSLMATLTLFVTTAASAAPTFKMPVPCGQTWSANNNNSSAHVGKELDLNRGSTAEADRGDTVVATAAGTVKTAKNQGTVNGYGNLVTIDHGGGWVSYYAHLETMAVVSGQAVLQGQPIGSVGNSSYRRITPHLHFEIRLGAGYPGNIQAVPGYNYARGGAKHDFHELRVPAGPGGVVWQRVRGERHRQARFRRRCGTYLQQGGQEQLRRHPQVRQSRKSHGDQRVYHPPGSGEEI